MSERTARVALGGTSLELLPGKAVWWPGERTLLVADAHVGKAVSYRRLGVPVPEATTAGTLDALDALLARHDARRIVFLGDLLHSRHAHAAQTLVAFERWRTQRPALEIVLVRGNHDDRAGDPPCEWGVHCVDEPFGLASAPHPTPPMLRRWRCATTRSRWPDATCWRVTCTRARPSAAASTGCACRAFT